MSERDIFIQALGHPDPAQRAAFLNEACQGDAALLKRLTDLLQSHESHPSGWLRVPQNVGSETMEFCSEEAPRLDPAAALRPFLSPGSREGSMGRVGAYEIIRILGSGGFGIVVEALDESLHRKVAIKFMHPDMARTSPPRKRFLREARAAAAVKHENVVQIYAVHEEPLPHLVMEFIEGLTLQAYMDAVGPIDPREILNFGRQMALGLAAAHEQGLIHRDFKPANLLIEHSREPKLKLSDFGLARTVDAASLTQSGLIAGTPMYMSPEQASGLPLDVRSDLFSLGSVLYAMCVGHAPFRAPSTLAVLKRVVDQDPRPIRDIIPEAPAGLVALVQRLLEKDPDQRFQSAWEVEAAFRQLAQNPEAMTAGPRRHRNRVPLVAAAVIVLTGGLAAWYFQPRETPPVPPGPSVPPASVSHIPADLPIGQQTTMLKERIRQHNPEYNTSKMLIETVDKSIHYIKFESTVNLFDLTPLRDVPSLRRVMLTNDGFPDISTLRGLRLTHLSTIGIAFRDLSYLKGMPLEFLNVWQFYGDSLEPIRGMPIVDLNCGGSEVKDLSPLQGMPLERLTISHLPVENLEPLTHATLKTLSMKNTQVRNIAPLANLRLTELEMGGSPIQDYQPLAKIRTLEMIDLDYVPQKHSLLLRSLPHLRTINTRPAAEILNAPESVSVLPETEWLAVVLEHPETERWNLILHRLKHLNPDWDPESSRTSIRIDNNKVSGYALRDGFKLRDLSPVKALPKISYVSLEGEYNFDLAAFKGMALEQLYSWHPMPDATPLAGMPLKTLWLIRYQGSFDAIAGMPLEDFRVNYTKFSDTTLLKRAKLRNFEAQDCPIQDITSLQGQPIETLNLDRTQVRDLTPLKDCTTLKDLRITDTPVTDLTPIQKLPIESISLTESDIPKHVPVLRTMTKLQSINGKPAAMLLKEYPDPSRK